MHQSELFINYKKEIIKTLKIMKLEFDSIISKFSKEYIYNRSLPYKTSSKCSDTKKIEVENQIKKFYFPIFDALFPMIEAGIVGSCLDIEGRKDNKFQNLFNDGADRLYLFQFIRYNLSISFIFQMYIFFEHDFIFNYINLENNEFNKTKLFDVIKILSKNCNIRSETKIKLDIYRNIINVYKHGKGSSLDYLEQNHNDIFNSKYSATSKNYMFLFNLNIVNYNDLYNTLIEFVEQIEY